MSYADFLASKRRVVHDSGRSIEPDQLHPSLFGFQQAVTTWALRKGRAAVWADTGLGKAQPVDEPVLTPAGWHRIGSLAVGDQVIAVDGTPSRVVGVYPQGDRPVVRVTFNDGASTLCDEDHLWTVATDLDLSRGIPWRTLTARELMHVGLMTGRRFRWRVPVTRPVQHPAADLAIDPYVLGVLLGDGTFRRPGIEFCVADSEIAAEVKSRLPTGMRLSVDPDRGQTPNYHLVVEGRTNWNKSNPYLAALRSWGFMGMYSHEKFVPAEYLTADVGQRLDLLRGLMDTDGTVSASGTVQFSTSSEALMLNVKTLVRSLGGIARLSTKTPTYTHKNEKRTGRLHYTLTLALPDGLTPFLLPRKVDRCRDRYYEPQRKIVAIEPEGRADCVCIAVEHPAHLYVTRDYVVTHNTRMQVEWARMTGERTLILAPLAVAHQTVREAAEIGVPIEYVRDAGEAFKADPAIVVTNYERLHKFDLEQFGAVVLDESSILKSFSGVTKRALVSSFRNTPYRLACTATPAPNDLEELCNHADFLGVMSPQEMRSTFFIADSRGEFMRYRLKRHAKEAFFRWLASWAIAVKRPSDLGFEDGPFVLPGLDIDAHYVDTDYTPDGQLFASEIKGVTEQAAVRKATTADRVNLAVELVEAEPDEAWLIWCGTNDESDLLAKGIPEAVEVRGSDSPEYKAESLLDFAEGRSRVLLTKASIAGFGMNFQRCARMVFVGLGYSYEDYYQALRRCHRFGQTRPVHAHIVLSDLERGIYEEVLRKERQAAELSGGLLEGMREHELAELFAGTSKGDSFEPSKDLTLPTWLVAS